MTTPEIVGLMIDALNASGSRYMVTGSLSSNVYGIVRSTKDADFVIETSAAQLDSVIRAVAPIFELDPRMSFETISMTGKTVLKHRDSDFSIELFDLSSDAHDQLRFSRRRRARPWKGIVAVDTRRLGHSETPVVQIRPAKQGCR